MVKLIQSKEEYTAAITATPIVVVDFYTDWCGPCKFIAPKIEEHENALNNDEATREKVSFLKVNVDELNELSGELNVSAIPTFFFYSGGEKVKTVVGADLKAIKKNITNLLATLSGEGAASGEGEEAQEESTWAKILSMIRHPFQKGHVTGNQE